MAKNKYIYHISKVGGVTVLTMNKHVTALVRNALEIVNPDEQSVEELARDIAQLLEEE